MKPNPKTAWDACPVVLLYQETIELHLKALIDEGSTFLKKTIDPITLYKTHSVRWLAQIACQIIKTIRWEREFKCEGVANLDDFSALVAEIDALNPVAIAAHASSRSPEGSVPHQLQPPNVVLLAKKLDALVDLLASTADGLAAEWDRRAEAKDQIKFKPTIH